MFWEGSPASVRLPVHGEGQWPAALFHLPSSHLIIPPTPKTLLSLPIGTNERAIVGFLVRFFFGGVVKYLTRFYSPDSTCFIITNKPVRKVRWASFCRRGHRGSEKATLTAGPPCRLTAEWRIPEKNLCPNNTKKGPWSALALGERWERGRERTVPQNILWSRYFSHRRHSLLNCRRN